MSLALRWWWPDFEKTFCEIFIPGIFLTHSHTSCAFAFLDCGRFVITFLVFHSIHNPPSLQVDEKVFKVERLSGLNPGLSRPSVTCSLSWNVPLHPGSHSEDSTKGTRTTSAAGEQRKCTQGLVCEFLSDFYERWARSLALLAGCRSVSISQK